MGVATCFRRPFLTSLASQFPALENRRHCTQRICGERFICDCTKGKKQRIYVIEAIETVLLIKQGKDKGMSLGVAIEAAREFRAQRAG